MKRSSGSSKSIKTLFISKKMLPVSVEESVNVVLSPSFYWFREEVLPAKSAPQAKKLAPSFFDGIIPEGDYEYMAVAHNEAFWLFAYESHVIMDALLDAGLKPSQIRAVYFAQLECGFLEAPVQVNDSEILIANDGVVSLLPEAYAEAAQSVQEACDNSPRSQHKVPVTLYRTGWLDEKQLGRLTVLAIVFLALYLGDFLLKRHQYKQQLIHAYTLQEHYHLPKTSFQLESMKRSLESKEARQLALRERFKKIIQLPLQSGEALKQFSVTEKKADVAIVLQDATRAEALKSVLLQHGRIASAKVKENIFYVSLSYE